MTAAGPDSTRRGFLAATMAVLLMVSGTLFADASEFPYDEAADAAMDIQVAQEAAAGSDRLLLLNFGANWCEDCRVLATRMAQSPVREAIASQFVGVKVDIGDWDKHEEVIEAWGNPIDGGIPSLVVARADGEILFSTKAGQLSRAREMTDPQFIELFDYLASLK